jgi:hypothetical protein
MSANGQKSNANLAANNAMGTNSANYSNVVREKTLPVVLDLAEGTFKVKGSRTDSQGLVEGKGDTAKDIMACIKKSAVRIRTERHRNTRLRKTANNRSAAAARAAAGLKMSQNEEAKLKANLATRRAAEKAKLQGEITKLQAALKSAQNAGLNTTNLEQKISTKQTALQGTLNAAMKSFANAEKAKENARAKANANAKKAANAAAAAKAAAPKSKVSFFGRMLGYKDTRRASRRNRRSSRRSSRRN